MVSLESSLLILDYASPDITTFVLLRWFLFPSLVSSEKRKPEPFCVSHLATEKVISLEGAYMFSRFDFAYFIK